MAGLVCQCSDVMMASCDVDTGGSQGALLLCVALLAYAAHWYGCCDGYDSDEEEEETDASRSMFSGAPKRCDGLYKDMGRTAKHKTRDDSCDKPPSVFADMPTISLLEAVVTKDPRWHWLEAAWDASEDAAVRELSGFVREHRVTLSNELAGHVRTVCAPAGGDEPVIVDPE